MFCCICILLVFAQLQLPHAAMNFVDFKHSDSNFLNKFSLRRTLFDLNEAITGRMLVTNLDKNFRGLFVMARRLNLWFALANVDELYKSNRRQGKMQKRILITQQFPCNITHSRSVQPPATVDRLRPGDIDVVASFGDSLSAGNGGISENLLHIANEFRGITFAGGGLGDWRTFLTLPNILKVFNPNLYGYSTADGLTVDSTSRFNIAEPMIMSRDLPFQAQTLIKRMRSDPNINMREHWKLLTIFVGSNDICSDICHHEDMTTFIQQHISDLYQTLTMLRNNIPRLLVNLMPIANIVKALYPMHNAALPLTCTTIHSIGCHCIFNRFMNPAKLQQISQHIIEWQQAEEHLARLPEFQMDDFAVLYQPCIANATLPTMPQSRNVDLRYMASDCFHFSQLGHAAMANILWNNMLQPFGQKQMDLLPVFKHFECPTAERPFIATLRNS